MSARRRCANKRKTIETPAKPNKKKTATTIQDEHLMFVRAACRFVERIRDLRAQKWSQNCVAICKITNTHTHTPDINQSYAIILWTITIYRVNSFCRFARKEGDAREWVSGARSLCDRDRCASCSFCGFCIMKPLLIHFRFLFAFDGSQ